LQNELRNAINGSIVGVIIGILNGVATLMVIGRAAVPGVLGVALIAGFSALGGAMFGAIIGSTGLFASRRISNDISESNRRNVA